jgi:polyhydroxyalkanoate synthase
VNSQLPEKADDWFKTATEQPGSWWPVWADWLKGHGGKLMNSPKALGSSSFKPIEPAPGRYVKAKA